jgi:outer membrane protein assembly factor BamB
VVGGRAYVLGARKKGGKKVEQVIALDEKGKELWAADVGPMYDWAQNQWSGGPNSSPAVDGSLVYALGSQGTLVCVEADGGKEKWRKDLPKDLGAEVSPGPGGPDKIGWGYSWSPLVDGDRLICTPGGAQGLFAALDKTKGDVLWRSKGLTDACTYSSPVVAEVAGVRQYVALVQDGVVGVAAKDGATLWEYRRDAAFPDVVCPTPLVKDNFVYITAWSGGGTLLKLTADRNKFKAEAVYSDKEIAPPHGGVVLLDGYVYGCHDLRAWECQDFASGTIKWRSKPAALGAGSLIAADGRLYCLTAEKGEVALVEASPDEFKEVSRFVLPKKSALRKPSGKVWTHPVLSDGKLYLRDQEFVFCYTVK